MVRISSSVSWWKKAYNSEDCYVRYINQETNKNGRFPTVFPSRETMRKNIHDLIVTVFFTQDTYSPSKHVSSYIFSPEMKMQFAWPHNVPFCPVFKNIYNKGMVIRKARVKELKKMRSFLLHRYKTHTRPQLWLNG